MAKLGVEHSWRGRAVAGAVFAFTIHLVVLGVLTTVSPRLPIGPPDARAISVDLVAPIALLTSRPRSASRTARPTGSFVHSPTVETVHPAGQPPAAVAVSPRPATPAPNMSREARPAGPALRNSLIGCAFSGMVALSDAERRHCSDVFAAGAKDGPDLSRFGLSPAKKAAFDAAADRENFLQKPVLSQRPKNGCKPFVDHQQYATLGASRDAYSLSFGCGKTF